MAPRHFFIWAAGTALALCCLAIILAVAVDPYRMYGTPPVPGWTARKPRTDTHQFIAKLYQLERVRPNTLLLGNSRVEVGLDPRSREWGVADRPVYNAALAGRGVRTALDMLRDAIAVHPPKTVILGLDIVDFLEKPDRLPASAPPIRTDERRLLVKRDGRPNPERMLQIWRDRWATTLTIDAVMDSVATLLEQDPRDDGTMTPLGFNPQSEYRWFVERQGYYALFAQKNEAYLKEYRHSPAPDFDHPLRYASFRYLKDIMDICEAHKIRLLMFIHPYHADFLDILHKDGLWPSFMAWKQALVRVTEIREPAGSADLRLFDFSGYNAFTTEAVPPPGDVSAAMRWYWESGHYKAALGDRILARLLRGARGFGAALSGTTIDAAQRGHRAAGTSGDDTLP